MIFLSRPISAVLLACAAMAIAVPTLTAILMRNRALSAPGT
jgi:TctA family transporter